MQGDEGMMFNENDFVDDSGMQVDAAATTNPALTGQTSSSSSVERIPYHNGSGRFFDQFWREMTITEAKDYYERHGMLISSQ